MSGDERRDEIRQAAEIEPPGPELPPPEWAVVEIMGHRSHAGRIEEVQRFGAAMIRIDVFAGDATEPTATHFYGGAAIFSMTPCTEALARKMADRDQPAVYQQRISYDDQEDDEP